MTRTAIPSARLPRAFWHGGLHAALVVALAATASPAAAAQPEFPETVYRFPFDPATTTQEGGEFASLMANGKERSAPHRGHDFAFGGALGVPIPAIADGIVRGKSSEGSLGNCVALEHPDGAFSAYCHMESPSPLELGQAVRIGEPVGRVGGTPDVPVHLHLTMGWSVEAMGGIGTFDPIPYIGARLAKPAPVAEAKPEAEAEVARAATHPPHASVDQRLALTAV